MAVTERSVNGVDVEQLEGAVEAIRADPKIGQFAFRVETKWTDALKCITTIDEFDQAGETITTRKFTIDADEPEQILGERTAPNAVELLLAALGSCLSVGYAANAADMGIELHDLRFELEGDIDLRGVPRHFRGRPTQIRLRDMYGVHRRRCIRGGTGGTSRAGGIDITADGHHQERCPSRHQLGGQLTR